MKIPALTLDAARGIVTRTGALVTPSQCPYLLDILNRRYNSGEWRAVRRTITLMKRRGWTLVGVWDGETMERPASTLEVLAVVFNLDEASLRFARADWHPPLKRREHGALVVLGNASDGSEVIADWNYTTGDPDGFDAAMDAVTGY